MIGMEQVNLLERKVKDAVTLIQQLRHENEYLRNRLSDYEVRIQELESLLSGLKASQTQIEEGILNAIADLNGLEEATQSSTVQTESHTEQSHHEDSVVVTNEAFQPNAPQETQSYDSTQEQETNWNSPPLHETSTNDEDSSERDTGLGIF